MTFTRPPLTMWSEEEMREIEIVAEPRQLRPRPQAQGLRRDLTSRGLTKLREGLDETTRGSVIYAPVYGPSGQGSHGNFIDASYRRILQNPDWARRLTKAHSAKRKARPTGPDEEVRAWCELDAATSSDALLMNIFCYPRALASAKLRALLGIAANASLNFGYQPRTSLVRDLVDRTEIDLKLGDLLLEAKLTEADFQHAPMRLLERYLNFDHVFDREALEVTSRGVRSYQLIRGVLAAHGKDARFSVLCDARRLDLIEAWYAIIQAVRSFDLRSRLQLITWQEIATTLPPKLAKFLAEKYGIGPSR